MNVRMKTFTFAVLLTAIALGCGPQGPQRGVIHRTKGQVNFVAAHGTDHPFHKRDCQFAMKIEPTKMETFTTREEAIQFGHRPCNICKP
jgi:hypothetical protein